MTQITIYLDESSKLAAQEAAAKANLSVSKWFAQFAEAERAKRNQDWTEYWASVDRHAAVWQEFPFTATLNQDFIAALDREVL